MDENKVSLYLVAIVGIVAAVGILVLFMGSDTASSEESNTDLTGQVARATGSPPRACKYTQYGGLESGQTRCGTGCCSSSQQCGDGRCH